MVQPPGQTDNGSGDGQRDPDKCRTDQAKQHIFQPRHATIGKEVVQSPNHQGRGDQSGHKHGNAPKWMAMRQRRLGDRRRAREILLWHGERCARRHVRMSDRR